MSERGNKAFQGYRHVTPPAIDHLFSRSLRPLAGYLVNGGRNDAMQKKKESCKAKMLL